MTDAVTQMSAQNNPHGAFILSTIGGLVTLGGGVFLSIWFMTGSLTLGGMMSSLSSLMSGFHEMMGSLGIPFSFMSGLSLIGLIAGFFMIVGAMMLRMQPYAHTSWGLVILVFSFISFLGTGGFLIGAALGIIGGFLAITWKPIHD
jgi:hypothetical protein